MIVGDQVLVTTIRHMHLKAGYLCTLTLSLNSLNVDHLLSSSYMCVLTLLIVCAQIPAAAATTTTKPTVTAFKQLWQPFSHGSSSECHTGLILQTNA